MKRQSVFVVMFDLPDLEGGGGAERRFAQIVTGFEGDAGIDVQLITDRDSLKRLNRVGYHPTAVVLFNHYSPSSFWSRTRAFLKRYHLQPLAFLWEVLRRLAYFSQLAFFLFNKRCLLHLGFFDARLWPLWLVLSRLPNLKLIQHVQSPLLAGDLGKPRLKGVSDRDTFWPLLFIRTVKFTGYFSLYQAFCDHPIVQSRCLPCHALQTATFGNKDVWKDVAELESAKKPLVLFAHRMVNWKNPMLFCEGVKLLAEKRPDLAAKWRFQLFGAGRLQSEVESFIEQNQLSDFVERREGDEVQHVMQTSKIFVCIQQFENFPSLSLVQAMQNLNLIVASDVGETRRLLSDSSAILLPELTAEALCAALCQAIDDDAMRTERAKAAYEESKKHTFSALKEELRGFWMGIATGRENQVR